MRAPTTLPMTMPAMAPLLRPLLPLSLVAVDVPVEVWTAAELRPLLVPELPPLLVPVLPPITVPHCEAAEQSLLPLLVGLHTSQRQPC